MRNLESACERWLIDLKDRRRGVFIVVLVVSLSACLAFVAFSVDTGMVVLHRTRMQNTVDAAALAAANEIGYAVENAGPNVGDVTAYAIQQARLKAQSVAALNGVFVDPAADVRFGRWNMDNGTGQSSITWDATPANAVKVTARRTDSDTTKQDGQLKTLFAGVFGKKSVAIRQEATAYIESRDIGVVLDFSSSMNDDSSYDVLGERDRAQLDANMEDIYDILKTARSSLSSMSFTPNWFQKTVHASSPDTRSTTVIFKNMSVDVTTTSAMSNVELTYTDDSTENKTASGTSGTFSHSSKSIKKAEVTINANLAPTSGSASGGSTRVAHVTFNNSTSHNIAVTTSPNSSAGNMKAILLTYSDNTTQNFTFSNTRSKTVTGNGKYVKSVKVTFSASGSPTATVNNPAGSSTPATFNNVVLTVEQTDANIQSWLGLGSYPWSSGSWSEFFNYCRTDGQISSAGHRYKYGGACLVNFLLKKKYRYDQCNDLWRTPHYPFHSVKQGTLMFCNFLEDLGFGDEVGAVSYDVNSRQELILNYDGYNIDLSANPISNNFEDVRQIVAHRQAAHYGSNTNIGAGLNTGKQMLEASKRAGTRPTLLIMTDGQATAQDSGWTFPSDWDWDALFDYDGDGTANYTTSDSNNLYALMRAKECVDAGYTIHTMTVGLGGDPALMEAIAFLGGGITITIPGDQTVAEMEEEVIAAFQKIAAFVPPARLANPD